MTAPQKAALAAVNRASAKTEADRELWSQAVQRATNAKAIFEGIRDGGLAAAQKAYEDALSAAMDLQTLVEITDTVAERNAELAFEAAMANPGAVVG